MIFLKQSTASQSVLIGPFIDETDGKTAENALTISNTDIRLSKNGGNMVAKNSGGGTFDEAGWYTITLDATDTNTVGRLQISVHESGALPVFLECHVLEEAVYDALFASSAPGYLQPTTSGRTLDVTATGAAGIDWGNVENKTTANDLSATDIQLCDTVTTTTTATSLTNKTGFSLASTGLDAITQSATGMVEIAKAVWDRLLTGGTHNIANSAGRRLRSIQETGAVYGGFIWIDTVNGTAGTTNYENGTSDNPVDSIADANTLSASLGITRFMVAGGSSITFAASQAGDEFHGYDWTLALGGQNVDGAVIAGASVSGICTGADPHFINCEIGNVTAAGGRYGYCGFSGTFTLSGAVTYTLHHCYSMIAGSASPTIDFGAAVGNTSVNCRSYSGGWTIENMGDTGTDTMSLEGNGAVTEGTCTGGNLSLRGNFKKNSITNITVTTDDDTTDIVAILTDTGTTIPATLAALNDVTAAEVVTALLADTTVTADGATSLSTVLEDIHAGTIGKWTLTDAGGGAVTLAFFDNASPAVEQFSFTIAADGQSGTPV